MPELEPQVSVPMVTITVTWGGHKLSPVQYNTFDVPQLTAQVTVPYDKLDDAIPKVHEKLRTHGLVLFERALHEHGEFLRKADAYLRSSGAAR
jgi:hypothetical protein